jgi:thiamine-phosphate pyrophosphorylase
MKALFHADRAFYLNKEKQMKLIIMTKATFFVEEDKILTTLFDEGLEDLHLYKPGSEPIYSERLLTLLSEDYHRKITVHDHFYLKEEYGLKGIHLNNATDEPPIGYRGNVTRTCHAIDELKEAKRKSSYVFLKSLFDSQTNPADKQSFSIETLQEAARRGLIDKKVYAMGGMNLDNIQIAKDLGFGGVVICGDLWNRFNIHNELDYKELIAHFRKLRKAIG